MLKNSGTATSQVHPDTLRNLRSAAGLNSRRFNDKSLVRKKVV